MSGSSWFISRSGHGSWPLSATDEEGGDAAASGPMRTSPLWGWKNAGGSTENKLDNAIIRSWRLTMEFLIIFFVDFIKPNLY
jgi:hypothetical protein